MSNRSETVKFHVTLDHEGVQRHAEALKGLGFAALLTCREGDTGYADYSVDIQYFGDVVAKLELFSTLLDDYRLVVKTDVEELNHGKSIIVGLVQKLTQIQDKLALKRFLDGTGGAPAPEPELPVVVAEPPTNSRRGFFAFLRDWFA